MAQPKSMYLRQVTVMLGLIILCMTLLGAGFFSLSYRYQLQEIQSTLDRNAGFISDYASVALTEGSSLTDKDFVNYIQSVVLLTDTTVLCATPRVWWSAPPAQTGTRNCSPLGRSPSPPGPPTSCSAGGPTAV